MHRRVAKIAAVSAVAVAVVVTAVWFFFVHQTQQAINRWADSQRENGIEVTWQSLRFTGYPLRIDARIGEPQILLRQPDRVTIWKPSFLTFKFSSIAPRAIDFVSPGLHALQVNGDDVTWSAVVEAETLEGQALFPPEDYRRIEQVTGRFAGLRVTSPAWANPVAVDQGNFEAAHRAAALVDPQAVHPQGVSFEFGLAARDIHLPEDLLQAGAVATLGPLISAFSTEMLVRGELNTATADVAALTAWRDGGGTVEFTAIELRWGSVRINANGTLALDGNLQPVGAFTTQIVGLEQFVTALETGGVLSSSDAAIARITLAILTRAPKDGGPGGAEIPITLQERILRLGPIALIQFPPITWE